MAEIEDNINIRICKVVCMCVVSVVIIDSLVSCEARVLGNGVFDEECSYRCEHGLSSSLVDVI